jgi:hypothetical protein
VVIDSIAILLGPWRPEKFHHFNASSLRRVASRLAANRASTSAAGIR